MIEYSAKGSSVRTFTWTVHGPSITEQDVLLPPNVLKEEFNSLISNLHPIHLCHNSIRLPLPHSRQKKPGQHKTFKWEFMYTKPRLNLFQRGVLLSSHFMPYSSLLLSKIDLSVNSRRGWYIVCSFSFRAWSQKSLLLLQIALKY